MSGCLLCVPITAQYVKEAFEQIKEAQRLGADLVELRLDLLDSTEEWEDLVKHCFVPKIATCRPHWEGGNYNGSESRRLSILSEACKLGCEYVDVELEAITRFEKPSNCHTKLILSRHLWNRPFSHQELANTYSSMLSNQADVIKVACKIDNIEQCEILFHFIAASKVPCIALGMGEAGQISRILAGRYGAFLTFASLSKGKESAPGQIELNDCIQMYRLKSLSSSTKLYGVIGNPVAHSMSPAIHNLAFASLSLDCVYCPLAVEDFGSCWKMLNEMGFMGLSVTIPHKETAKRYVDELDGLALKIGAINTMVKLERGWKGYNTDCLAAVSAIEDGLIAQRSSSELSHRTNSFSTQAGAKPLVLILGAGGAARAIAFGLLERSYNIYVVNRNYDRCKKLAAELGIEAIPWEGLRRFLLEHKDSIDVIIQSTSIGMHPNVHDTPLSFDDLQSLSKKPLVFDVVYNPVETRFLREAREVGCYVVSGLEMFVRQAVYQFELWTGSKAPVEQMRQVVLKRLKTFME
ncbi:Bifunctional 3-dehydroquinate dehydratase/shikimate dehydrogenase, chloroplastic [Galdieria sulphuraria]|nr:Bifunctional 3-dehydroquinate dehydratase/shikimate dehydrogenase, chloroplastic [Galdieria sulphuraria]